MSLTAKEVFQGPAVNVLLLCDGKAPSGGTVSVWVGGGGGVVPVDLLPKGKALQPHGDAFGCQYRLGKMCFDFGLVLPHYS